MHAICLVYANSGYYNTTARIMVLMQESCNLLIDVSRRFLDPSSIFQIEVEEALDNVKIAIRNLKEFKTCFQEYKVKVPSYFPSDVPPKPWEFQVNWRICLIFTDMISNRKHWFSRDSTASKKGCMF